jgi:hypothetical protein
MLLLQELLFHLSCMLALLVRLVHTDGIATSWLKRVIASTTLIALAPELSLSLSTLNFWMKLNLKPSVENFKLEFLVTNMPLLGSEKLLAQKET